MVIVPAHNEAQNIGRVIRDLFRHEIEFKQINSEGFRLIVIDDGSTDRTAEIARAAGATVLSHSVNRGQGAALETGNEYARTCGADVVVHFDGDGQFNSADILPAVAFMRTHELDLVLGSRFLDKRSQIPWLKQHIFLPLGRWLNNAFTEVALTDFHNGFRVLSRHALDAIRITQDGMAHNTEIISQMKPHGLRFSEFPVAVTYTRFGQSIGGGLKIVWDLIFKQVS